MIWTYTVVDKFEQAHWVLPRSVLRPHLHSAIQITLVLEGELGFHTSGGNVFGSAGDAFVIPAGTLHQALTTLVDRGLGLNLYVPLANQTSVPTGQGTVTILRNAAIRPRHALIGLAREIAATKPAQDHRWQAFPLDVSVVPVPVGAAAVRCGMTREAFSRAFTHEFGISPKAFSLGMRLDRARCLLSQGWPMADAAAALSFADQSHLGRLFKAAYGTTPGRYKSTMWIGSKDRPQPECG